MGTDIISRIIAVFNLPKDQWLKVLKGAGIAALGAGLVYLGQALGLGELAQYLIDLINGTPENVVSDGPVVDGIPPWLLWTVASTAVNYFWKLWTNRKKSE